MTASVLTNSPPSSPTSPDLRAGTVGINGYQLEPNAEFGGSNQSGLGREGGRTAIKSYTELKTVMRPFTDEM
jgi:aldehyde dehydrogenase (NAD+)